MTRWKRRAGLIQFPTLNARDAAAETGSRRSRERAHELERGRLVEFGKGEVRAADALGEVVGEVVGHESGVGVDDENSDETESSDAERDVQDFFSQCLSRGCDGIYA